MGRTQKVSAVVEKTEIYCARAQERRGGTRLKMKSVMLTVASSHPVAFHRNSQFSRQPLAAFKYRFDFSDLPITLDHLQRPNTFRSANLRLLFPIQVAFLSCSRFSWQFSIISATVNPCRIPFRDSGPIQHK